MSLADGAIDAMVDHTPAARSPWSFAIMFHLGGRVADAAPEATAYSRRHVTHELNVNAVWLPHEPLGGAETGWARAFAADLAPHASGAYVNFLDRDDHDRQPTAFAPPAYQRLLGLRERFDPDHVFQRVPDTRSATHTG